MNVIGAVNRAKMPPRNIPPQELKTLKELAGDEDILCFHLTRAGPRWSWTEQILMKMHKMLSEEHMSTS